MAKRKWKGTISQDLTSLGGGGFKKGDTVVCWKSKMFEDSIMDDRLEFRGRYEYHYQNIKGEKPMLVRTTQFLIEEFNEPNL
jgi:hypothetical protein